MSARAAVVNAAVTYGPRLLGGKAFARIAHKLGRDRNLDLAAVTRRQLDAHAGARLYGRTQLNAFTPALFSAYYGELDANLIVPDTDFPSARSFVPYYRGFTSVVLFNFFKANYGIRDPILYRYSIVADGAVAWSEQFLLPGDGVRKIEDPARSGRALPERGTLLLEAFHPKIGRLPQQLRYIALYRDRAAGLVCGSHSIVVTQDPLVALGQPGYRAFGVTDAAYRYHAATADGVPLTLRGGAHALRRLSASQPVPLPGYLVQESSSGCPSAVWHDGVISQSIRPAPAPRGRVGACYTTFAVPDFARHAPRVLISSGQVGFLPRRVTFHLLADAGAEIASKTLDVPGDEACVDLAAEFPGVRGMVNVVVEFDRDAGEFPKLPSGMVHVYYRSPAACGDQGHSHTTLGYHDDPFRRPKSYRCRKFAPFLADDALDFTYSVVNLGVGLQPVKDRSIRIRIFTDSGGEHVLLRELSGCGMTNFRAEELLRDVPVKPAQAAVFQFEHESTNYSGTWYAVDRSSGHLGTDHFTGG